MKDGNIIYIDTLRESNGYDDCLLDLIQIDMRDKQGFEKEKPKIALFLKEKSCNLTIRIRTMLVCQFGIDLIKDFKEIAQGENRDCSILIECPETGWIDVILKEN